MIPYLHGFRSAPASIKARARSRRAWSSAASPIASGASSCRSRRAPRSRLVEDEIARARAAGLDPPWSAARSGGYYATWLAERHELRAVLVNPGGGRATSLEAYVGIQDNLYTGERSRSPAATSTSCARSRCRRSPCLERFWLMVETGDEVLDYRHAVESTPVRRQTVLEGGDHGFALERLPGRGDRLRGLGGSHPLTPVRRQPPLTPTRAPPMSRPTDPAQPGFDARRFKAMERAGFNRIAARYAERRPPARRTRRSSARGRRARPRPARARPRQRAPACSPAGPRCCVAPGGSACSPPTSPRACSPKARAVAANTPTPPSALPPPTLNIVPRRRQH